MGARWHTWLVRATPLGACKNIPTTFDCLCCPMSMMACHTRRRSTLCAVQGLWWHATPDIVRLFVLPKRRWLHATPYVVRPCVLSKGSDVMHHPTMLTVCAVQGRWCLHATPDIVDRVCCPRAVMSCHDRRRRIVFASSQRRSTNEPCMPSSTHAACLLRPQGRPWRPPTFASVSPQTSLACFCWRPAA